MAFNAELPEWNKTAAAPPQTNKDNGWSAEDYPPASWFNWFFNVTYKALQELQQEAINVDQKGVANGIVPLSVNNQLNIPNQSNISAYRAALLSLTSGVDSKILFDTFYRDVQTELNHTTSEVTLKEGGLYLVNSYLSFTGPVSGNSYLKLNKNGAYAFALGGTTGVQVWQTSKICQFVAGDKLTFYIAQNSGANATLNTCLIEITKLA